MANPGRTAGRRVVASIVILCVAWPPDRLTGAVDPCAAPWVARQRAAAAKAGKRFALVRQASFQEKGVSYTVGITYSPESDSLTLAVFAAASGEPRQVYSQEIGILSPASINPDAPPADTCPAPDFRLYFRVAVLDLDSDGTHEIVVESNEGGGCARCLSQVRVYKAESATVKQVVDESYNGISFGAGKGLTVDSFITDDAGEASPTRKTFFMPTER